MTQLSLPRGLSLALLAVVFAGPTEAGTGLVVVRDERVLAGASGEGFPEQGRIWFVPGKGPASGRVLFGSSRSDPVAGLNEAGLFFEALPLPGAPDVATGDKPPLAGRLASRALRSCATVDEVRALAEANDIGSGDEQLLFADATGAAILVERNAVHAMEGSYLVATNFRLSRAVEGELPCPRYEAARSVLEKPDLPALDAARDALSAACQESTAYSAVCDLARQRVHFWVGRNFRTAASFDLAEELRKGEREVDLQEFFEGRLLLADTAGL